MKTFVHPTGAFLLQTVLEFPSDIVPVSPTNGEYLISKTDLGFATTISATNTKMFVEYLEVLEPSELVHDRSVDLVPPFTLPVGKYKIIEQREYE